MAGPHDRHRQPPRGVPFQQLQLHPPLLLAVFPVRVGERGLFSDHRVAMHRLEIGRGGRDKDILPDVAAEDFQVAFDLGRVEGEKLADRVELPAAQLRMRFHRGQIAADHFDLAREHPRPQAAVVNRDFMTELEAFQHAGVGNLSGATYVENFHITSLYLKVACLIKGLKAEFYPQIAQIAADEIQNYPWKSALTAMDGGNAKGLQEQSLRSVDYVFFGSA
jgi:hypothetical protein